MDQFKAGGFWQIGARFAVCVFVCPCAIAFTFGCNAGKPNVRGDDLINAAKQGDLPRVKTLVADGADVNAKNSDGATALMVASETRNLEVVQSLLAKGADVNAKANDGQTALFKAVSQRNNEDVVEALIGKGADVNARTNGGGTALMAASELGQQDVSTVQYLIAKGADVNAKANDGETALGRASPSPYELVSPALVHAGATSANLVKHTHQGRVYSLKEDTLTVIEGEEPPLFEFSMIQNTLICRDGRRVTRSEFTNYLESAKDKMVLVKYLSDNNVDDNFSLDALPKKWTALTIEFGEIPTEGGIVLADKGDSNFVAHPQPEEVNDCKVSPY
jgi:ankyrin repeat protein